MPTESFTKISLREFLIPEKALQRTGALDNPLLTYSLRRSRRWPRRIAQHCLEAILLVLGAFLFNRGLSSNLFSSLMGMGYSYPTGIVNTDLTFVLTALLSFLLLRYHLMVNDQSHHLKTLRPDHLQQLFLTRLKREEYYLHHYLHFCRNYRVMWGLAGLAIFSFAYGAITNHTDWLIWWFCNTLFGLSLVLMTWLIGVSQYAFEWRHFAGTQSSVTKNFGTLIISLIFSLLAFWAAYALTSAILATASGSIILGLFFVFPGFPLIMLAAAALTHWQGMGVYQDVTELLWRRFAKEDPDWKVAQTLRKTHFWDWILPWRCFAAHGADKEALAIFKRHAKHDKAAAFFSGALLSLAFFICTTLSDIIGVFLRFSSFGYFRYDFFVISQLLMKFLAVFLPGYVACRIIRAREKNIPFSPGMLLFIYGRWFILLSLLLSLLSNALSIVRTIINNQAYPGMVYDELLSGVAILRLITSLIFTYFSYLSLSFALCALLLIPGRVLFSERRWVIFRFLYLLLAGFTVWIAFLLLLKVYSAAFDFIFEIVYYNVSWMSSLWVLQVFLFLAGACLLIFMANSLINHILSRAPGAPPPLPAAATEGDYVER